MATKQAKSGLRWEFATKLPDLALRWDFVTKVAFFELRTELPGKLPKPVLRSNNVTCCRTT